MNSRAKANEKIVRMGGGLLPPPMAIMVSLALALDFTVGSKIYPSV